MCIAVPGRVVELHDQDGSAMGRVDFRGEERLVSLAYVPEVRAGDWVLVHLGMAIQHLDEEAAQQTLALFAEAGLLDREPDEPEEVVGRQ